MVRLLIYKYTDSSYIMLAILFASRKHINNQQLSNDVPRSMCRRTSFLQQCMYRRILRSISGNSRSVCLKNLQEKGNNFPHHVEEAAEFFKELDTVFD